MKACRITSTNAALSDELNALYDHFEQEVSESTPSAPEASAKPMSEVTITDIRSAFLKVNHMDQLARVTMNVPWSPNCTSDGCYDFVSIAKSCDFLFVMPSDFDRQKWDYCFAKANAPYDQTYAGLSAYIKLGVDSRKLIMGISWLGLDYPCTQLFEPGRCKLREYQFRGSRCSSFVATWIPYKQIMELLLRSITGRYWDDNYKSPYFVYKVNNIYHEVWYDDPESISLRSTIVRKLNLGGLGAWSGNSLSYSVNPIEAMQTEEMWNALSPIRRKWRI
ncbi:di-N-acetylchitobiase-like [Mustelus asterias]